MEQSLPRLCPSCGTATVARQKFCPKCGLRMTDEVPEQAPDPPDVQVSAQDDAIESIPTHVLPASQVQEPSQSPHAQTEEPSGPQSSSVQTEEPPGPQSSPLQAVVLSVLRSLSAVQAVVLSALQSLSALVKHRLDMRRVRISLALLLILVAIGFVVFALLQAIIASSQPEIKTTALGTTVNYAGVDITIVNAQTSRSFLDDPHSTSDGMLRLQLRAQNKTALAINLPYETIAHVTLPEEKSAGKTQRLLSPTYVKSSGHVAAHATEDGLVDFAVSQDVRVDQVVFHLGSANEAQLDIPLNRQADVAKYASKTIHPNQPIAFYGLNWSLTDASTQLHIDGQQASKGMRYLILTLKVDNPLDEIAIPGSPYDYAQLQANNTPGKLINTTLPVAFEVGASGKVGTLTFLVPQGDTSFTLTLANTADGFGALGARSRATFQL
jgi:hypothetical protein